MDDLCIGGLEDKSRTVLRGRDRRSVVGYTKVSIQGLLWTGNPNTDLATSGQMVHAAIARSCLQAKSCLKYFFVYEEIWPSQSTQNVGYELGN